MPKTLSQLRIELSNRLGFGSQQGAAIIQTPMLESILQQAQNEIIEEFGSQIGSTIPATSFNEPNDLPSVPETPLFIKALLTARGHYQQDTSIDADKWNRWVSSMRGFA